jgi:hypothetical protein
VVKIADLLSPSVRIVFQRPVTSSLSDRFLRHSLCYSVIVIGQASHQWRSVTFSEVLVKILEVAHVLRTRQLCTFRLKLIKVKGKGNINQGKKWLTTAELEFFIVLRTCVPYDDIFVSVKVFVTEARTVSCVLKSFLLSCH